MDSPKEQQEDRKSMMSDDLRNAISRLKGEMSGPDMISPDSLTRMLPVSAEIAREEEMLKNPQPGQFFPEKGVFVGLWVPQDRDGNSLNKTFNLFAAPYDLGLDEKGKRSKLVIPYNDAVIAVGEISNLMGHEGATYKNDTALFKGLRSGTYKGEWFIPPQEILNGLNLHRKKIQRDNLYRHRYTGRFMNTFATVNGSEDYHRYWSCSMQNDVASSRVWGIAFTYGGGEWFNTNNPCCSTRLVRAELRL